MSGNGITRLQKVALFVTRILLGYLFFTQLFWKFPPQFGCPDDFAFTTGTVQDGIFIEATQCKSGIRIYDVFGMNCPGCHGAVEKLVKKIPAVEEAEANWKEQRLTVTVRPGSELNDEDIYDAVRRANFTPGKRKQ